MNEDKSRTSAIGRPGSRTTKENRPKMIMLIKSVLRDNNVIFHANFMVSQKELSTCGVLKDAIVTQLRGFNRIVVFPKIDKHKGADVIYHGKFNGNNDDFVMCMMINLLMFKVFMQSDSYKNERRNYI
jgi:hypothetical protein